MPRRHIEHHRIAVNAVALAIDLAQQVAEMGTNVLAGDTNVAGVGTVGELDQARLIREVPVVYGHRMRALRRARVCGLETIVVDVAAIRSRVKNHWPRRAIALLCIDGTVDRGREQCADNDSDHRPKPPISCKGILAGRRTLNSSFCLRDNCRAQELEIDEIASCRGQAARPLRLVTSFRAKGGRTALPALDILSLPPRTAPRRC